MYLTARSYLLAGFTAASIVAAIPLAPRPSVDLPSMHSADVRLEAAESEVAAKVRTLRAVEGRVLAAVVDRTTTVVPGLAHRLSAATDGHAVPRATSSAPDASSVGAPAAAAAGTTADRSGTAQHAPTSTATGPITPSDLVPLIGDVAAFNFDLLGTPFGIVTALSFAGDLAISDLSSGMLQDIPGDVGNSLGFGIASQLNLLTADINVLTNEINHLSATAGTTAPSITQGAGTGTVGTPTSVAGTTPLQTSAGTFDPSALGPLVGDAATLGLDVAATPFQLVQSLTSALSGAAMDLGAGQVQDAKHDFVSRLQTGFVEAEQRLSNDVDGIGATLARLTGTSNTTAGPVGTANLAVGSGTTLEHPKAARPSAPEAPVTDAGPRPDGSQPAPSAPTAKPVGAEGETTVYNPRPVDTAAGHPATVPQRVSPDEPETAKVPARQGTDPASNAKPPSSPPGETGTRPNGANPAKSALGKPHTDGPNHGKH